MLIRLQGVLQDIIVLISMLLMFFLVRLVPLQPITNRAVHSMMKVNIAPKELRKLFVKLMLSLIKALISVILVLVVQVVLIINIQNPVLLANTQLLEQTIVVNVLKHNIVLEE